MFDSVLKTLGFKKNDKPVNETVLDKARDFTKVTGMMKTISQEAITAVTKAISEVTKILISPSLLKEMFAAKKEKEIPRKTGKEFTLAIDFALVAAYSRQEGVGTDKVALRLGKSRIAEHGKDLKLGAQGAIVVLRDAVYLLHQLPKGIPAGYRTAGTTTRKHR